VVTGGEEKVFRKEGGLKSLADSRKNTGGGDEREKKHFR